jgi:putative FmdB family regulatory protein
VNASYVHCVYELERTGIREDDMPNYDYVCKQCGHRFEAFQSMKDEALSTCPECATQSLQRLIGAGAGLLFKGSGYYQTDYKKSSSPASAAPTESSPSTPDTVTPANGDGSETTAKPAAATKASSS